MAGLVDRWIAFLDEHRLFRRWVVPVLFMALVLFPLFLFTWTTRQSVEVLAVFLAASLAVATGGMVLQLGIERYVRRKRRG